MSTSGGLREKLFEKFAQKGFIKPVKSQISSTKIQTNSKSQYLMTKTFISAVLHRFVITDPPMMIPLAKIAWGLFVWNFEIGSLEFIWDLIFGVWNFRFYDYLVNLTN
jgi:hypothetical protein